MAAGGNKRNEKNIVKNINGAEINYQAAEILMDDELREQLHMEIAPCSEQEFFRAYEKAHKNRFEKEWELSDANPTY